MGFQSRRELLCQIRPRYQAATRKVKREILNEFVRATGYHRKYALRLLNGPVPAKPAAIRRPRVSPYLIILDDLKFSWAAANCICAKRLVPFLPQLVPLLELHEHLVLSPERRELLLSISVSTADRLLQPSRRAKGKGLSTTKPGTLLKRQIPLRTFTEWEDTGVGFFEVDLVAHCGTSIAGTFLWSLVMTDVASGWTECYPLLRRTGHGCVSAIRKIQEGLPFRILGIDVDNGSEFINEDLMEFCKMEQITFTRGRAYRKNDQCFVEQKNGSIVRNVVGYDRFDGQDALARLSKLYQTLRIYTNFYQPSMKLQAKSRDGSKVHRTYDRAQTPLNRVLAANVLPPATRERLDELGKTLDPVGLLRLLQAHQDALWKLADVPKIRPECELLPPYDPASPTQLPPLSETQARKYRSVKKPSKLKALFDAAATKVKAGMLLFPKLPSKELFRKLQEGEPGVYPDRWLRPLQAKVNAWRAEAGIPRPPTPRKSLEPALPATTPAKSTKTKVILDRAEVQLKEWMLTSPELTCKQLLQRLRLQEPDSYPDRCLRTLQKRVSAWRAVAGIKRPYGPRPRPVKRTGDLGV